MHGTNKVRGAESLDNGRRLQVREIFYTLQGEGPHSGLPAVFVRLTGCNLRCHFCDTKWDDENDPVATVKEIADRVEQLAKSSAFFDTSLVVLTGGEPLRQDLSLLLHELIERRRFKVQIETAGTLWQDCLGYYGRSELEIVVSPKTPAISNNIRKRATAFKYIVDGSTAWTKNGIPIANTQSLPSGGRALAEPLHGTPVYLSPCDFGDKTLNDTLNRAALRAVAGAAMRYGHRAGVQLHKLLELE